MFNNRIPPRVTAGVLAALTGVAAYLHWPAPQKPEVPVTSNSLTYFDPNEHAVGLRAVTVETLAGDEAGFADGPLWKARFSGPTALALEPGGGLLVCDSRNHRLRRISPDDTVSTVAGGGEAEGTGGWADGSAAEARFRNPAGVAVGLGGTIYLSDAGNHRICVIRNGQVRTLAGSTPGRADGKGGAARFQSPGALTLVGGALWVADTGNSRIRRITLEGAVTTPAQVPPAVRSTLGDCGARHVPGVLVSSNSQSMPGFFLERSRQRTAARGFADNTALASALDTAPASAPRVYADSIRHGLFLDLNQDTQVLLAGIVTSTGSEPPRSLDGGGHEARFAGPRAVVLTDSGAAYVAEYDGNRIRRVVLTPALFAELVETGARAQYRN